MKLRDPEPKRFCKRKRRPKQLDLPVRTHGGKRKGAGRKRVAPRPRVVHRTRPELDGHHPVHVTIRIKPNLPKLRGRVPMRAITKVLIDARERFGLRVIQFAVLRDHLHFIVEARDRDSLSHGMRGLGTRLAIHINRAFDRGGKLFDDRYHARALKSPLEVRNGLVYVLNNFRKHAGRTGQKIASHWIDPCSSGPCFDGWREPPELRAGTKVDLTRELGILPPRTWLLRVGWRRRGLIAIDEVPGGASPASSLPAAAA